MAQSDNVMIEVDLPREAYERLAAQAGKEHKSLPDMIPSLIEEGLQSRMTAREIMERVSAEYHARIAASGERDLTTEELLEKLRRDREEIVKVG